MGGSGYLLRRPRPGPPRGDPDGPAVATLHIVAMRTAALVRGIGIGYVVVQVVIGGRSSPPTRPGWPAR